MYYKKLKNKKRSRINHERCRTYLGTSTRKSSKSQNRYGFHTRERRTPTKSQNRYGLYVLEFRWNVFHSRRARLNSSINGLNSKTDLRRYLNTLEISSGRESKKRKNTTSLEAISFRYRYYTIVGDNNILFFFFLTTCNTRNNNVYCNIASCNTLKNVKRSFRHGVWNNVLFKKKNPMLTQYYCWKDCVILDEFLSSWNFKPKPP